MLKRIFTIALLTGIGQLFVIFSLKYVSNNRAVDHVKAIGQIDSLVLFMMSVIGMGLQSAAIRDIALSIDWKTQYRQTQSARATLGLLLSFGAIFAFMNPYYIIFLAAPLFGWNGDYALYARGHSVAGSAIAFVRLVVPFSCLAMAAYYQSEWLAEIYLISLIIVYSVSNFTIARILKTPYFFEPVITSLRLYIDSIYLGVVILSLYFIGLGLMLVLPYFYEDTVVAVAFLGLKAYVIFKGALRIIHQAFIKEMTDPQVSGKVDQIAGLLGMTFLVFIGCFPDTIIKFFFGEKLIQYKLYFILTGVAALLYSVFSSLIITAMLEKKDKKYALIGFISAAFTILVCIFFSFTHGTIVFIGLSLVLGELFFSSGMLILMSRPGFIQERLLFIAKNIIFFLIPVAARFFFNDEITPFVLSFCILAVVLINRYRDKFNIGQNELISKSAHQKPGG